MNRSKKKLLNPKEYSQKYPVVFPELAKFAINGKPLIYHPNIKYFLNYIQFEVIFNSGYSKYLK